MRTRSKRAPESESPVFMGARSVAPASRSSTVATRMGTGRAASVTMPGGVHLREQLGRPAAAAEHGVLGDAPVADAQVVDLVAGVGHAVLLPGEAELDQAAARKLGD